jgi:hypothetical protein
MSVLQKLGVLGKLDRRMRVVLVRHCYGVHESTVSFVEKMKVTSVHGVQTFLV